jgi:hypothetical protein
VTAREPPRKRRFDFPSLDVQLASASAKRRPGAHIVGRPLTNYLSLPSGSAAVDAVADRLADNDTLGKGALIIELRHAVLSAHAVGSREIVAFINSDPAKRAAVALRALRALSVLVYDPGFIPAILQVASFVAAEHPSYAERARELARALDYVPLLEAVLKAAPQKPVERKNPGRPYMAGLTENLVGFWHVQTGKFPSKTRKSATRSKSRRVLFWDFLDRALVDLSLQGQPIEHHVRSAIDRLQKGERPPHK